MALTELRGLLISTLPSAVAATLAPGALIATLPLSSTETPTPGAWMETGESELADGVEPAAGADGLDGAELVDAAGGWLGEDDASELVAGSACVPM